ncbi:hypothetical protein NDU88_008374 [Pleurodeles waltl]|uniref:Uncharacterized protein n=1 Tax=Pleurodeles waltl TaxID=8319 RepID=A0AAV7N4R8_PLEWA|nr:hypothetical protein NDU88_008374 [Pleurodeles waltl]
MKRNEAPGPDLVPVDLCHEAPYYWAEILTKVFNPGLEVVGAVCPSSKLLLSQQALTLTSVQCQPVFVLAEGTRILAGSPAGTCSGA